MEHLNCRGYNELNIRLTKVETEQDSMKSDIMEIKQSLKENRVFTITILASTLVGSIGTIIVLLGGV
jgi:hypothetical protein